MVTTARELLSRMGTTELLTVLAVVLFVAGLVVGCAIWDARRHHSTASHQGKHARL